LKEARANRSRIKVTASDKWNKILLNLFHVLSLLLKLKDGKSTFSSESFEKVMGAKCFIFCDVNCVITVWFGSSQTVWNFRALFICLSRFLGNAGNSTKFSRLIFNRLSFNKQIKLLYNILPVWFVFFYCGFCQWVFKGQFKNFRGKSSCK